LQVGQAIYGKLREGKLATKGAQKAQKLLLCAFWPISLSYERDSAALPYNDRVKTAPLTGRSAILVATGIFSAGWQA
jgi:hypothetical protein